MSKNESSFNFLRMPYSSNGGSSSSRRGLPYWRKLFARSSSSGAVAIHPRKLSGSTIGGNSGSAPAPHIKTLNMTRASFSLNDEEITTRPTPPAPVHVHVQQGRETKESSSMDDESYEKVADVESGRTRGGELSSWQQNVVDDRNRTNGGGNNNETMRAQYEIHSRE